MGHFAQVVRIVFLPKYYYLSILRYLYILPFCIRTVQWGVIGWGF